MKKGLLITAIALVPLMIVSMLVGAVVVLSSLAGAACGIDDPGNITSAQVQIDGDNVSIDGKPLRDESLGIAQEIIGQGRKRGLSDRDIRIALATGYQESGLRNLRHGHLDSLGVYQQRPSVKVWGTAEEILQVPHAVSKFYDALEAIKDRASMSMKAVALKVQGADPAAYDSKQNSFDSWLPLASALLGGVTGNVVEAVVTTTLDCALDTRSGSAVPHIDGVAYGAIGNCPAGQNAGVGTYVNGQKLQLCSINGVVVEAGISAKLQAMFTAARSDGIVLSGSGYRSYQRQIELRRQNCGTSDYAVYQMPSEQCHPSTAIPGRSNHEKGRAVDLRSQYGGMSQGDPAHNWMLRNGQRFGFTPYSVEPWHWNG